MPILRTKMADTNINERERWASLIGGGSLVAFGLAKRNLSGLALAAIGGGLIARGATGHSNLYRSLGINTADRRKAQGTGRRASVPYELGVRIDESLIINRPAAELYRFWRKLDNLPKFMDHLTAVEVLNDRESHWIAKGPAGFNLHWDAEIINDIENHLIGWRSLEGASVDNAGSVRFESTPSGGTEVKISLQYNPPAGSLGAAVARMLGDDPKFNIREDLKRFKDLMEMGVLASKASGPARLPESKSAATKVWDRDAVNQSSEESFPASDPPSWTPEHV